MKKYLFFLLAIGFTAISCNSNSDEDSEPDYSAYLSEYVGKWYYYSNSSSTIAKGTELTISSSGFLTWTTPDGDTYNGTIKAFGDGRCDITYNGKTYNRSEVYTYKNGTFLDFNVNGDVSLAIKDFPFDGVYSKEYVAGISTPKAVDLGLSVKWADRNLGARKVEDYGDYYAWGETCTKNIFTDETSLLTGYYPATLANMGVLDSRGNLTSKYDAATHNLGDGWRLPTFQETRDLETKCTYTWTFVNGIAGLKITSKKNGNSIFLPAAGDISTNGLINTGKAGFYWSSTECGGKENAYALYIGDNTCFYDLSNRRCGFTIRAVKK